MAPDRITLRRPDDWHLHLRDGAMLAAVAAGRRASFARAIVMPNLVPPVTTVGGGARRIARASWRRCREGAAVRRR